MNEALLDEAIFKRFCMILKGKTPHHLSLLSSGCDELIKQMRNNQFDSVIFSTHKLKSTSAQIGAKSLSGYITQIEKQLLPLKTASLNTSDQTPKEATAIMAEMVDKLELLMSQTQNILDHAQTKYVPREG